MNEDLAQFEWKPCPEGQSLLDELIDRFITPNEWMCQLRQEMHQQTGTRFFDWIDHLQLEIDESLSQRLISAGFENVGEVWEHKGAVFPRIKEGSERRLVLKVESVADFLAAHSIQSEIEGIPFGQLRKASVKDELWLVERRGCRGFSIPEEDAVTVINSLKVLEAFLAVSLILIDALRLNFLVPWNSEDKLN